MRIWSREVESKDVVCRSNFYKEHFTLTLRSHVRALRPSSMYAYSAGNPNIEQSAHVPGRSVYGVPNESRARPWKCDRVAHSAVR